MKKLILIAASVLICLPMLNAQRPNPQFRNQQNFNYQDGNRNNGKQNNCINLNLTDEQNEQISELRLEHLKITQKMNSELRILMAEYRALNIDENPDMKAIDVKIDAIQDLKAEIMKLRARQRLEVKNLLSDDQKVMYNNRQGFRHNRNGNRGRNFQQRRIN